MAKALDTSSRALLRRLWRGHVAGHRRGILIALACTLGVAATTALYPVVIQQSFDRYTEGRHDWLWLVPVVIVVVTSLKAVAQFGQAVAIQSVVLRVIEGLQNDLFRALTRADLAAVAREAPARHAARFTTDAALIREALTKSINAVADALTLVGLVASMVWLDWRMSLIGGLLYPIAVLPILKLGKRIRRASGGMQERVGEAAAALTESFGAARVVRSYRLEAAEEARAAGLFARLRESLFSIARTRASLDPMLEALGGFAVAAVLVFVGWRVAAGDGDGRRIHRLRRRAADRLAPGARAGLAECGAAGRAGRSRARLWRAGCAAAHRRCARCRSRCRPAMAASPSPAWASPMTACRMRRCPA